MASGPFRDCVDTSFRAALRRLDAAGRLLKVRREVSTSCEVAALMKRYDGDRALFFEHVAGYSMPIVGNLIASQANCEAAFGMDFHGLRASMERAIGAPIPPREVSVGSCQEVVVTDGIDLEKMLPVLQHTPGDAGRFITSGVVVVRDPHSGVYNASYHRLQLLGANRTAIRLDFGRHLRTAFERARDQGQALPIAVCVGPDLALAYAAAFMGAQMPLDADELAAAGGIRGAPLDVVHCVTQDLVVPAESELVLEGTISPTETAHEGPFGEFVGYQSDAGPAPVLHITALTRRERPIYHAINGAGRETIMLRKYVLEASALRALKAAVPIVEDVEMPAGGLHRFTLIVQVRKRQPQDEGLQRNAILAAFGAQKDLNTVIVVDDDIALRDPDDVIYALATRMDAARDLMIIPGARGHEYVRVSNGGIGTKLGIDATVPFEDRERFRRVEFASASLAPEDTHAQPSTFLIPDETRRA
jgi:2,5-furandicarboxylate decarboxylase 1